MVLVEDYTPGSIDLAREMNIMVASVEFTLDRDAMVTLSTAGAVKYAELDGQYASRNTGWLTMNNDSLDYSLTGPWLNGSYFFALKSGTYKFDLRVNVLSEYPYSRYPNIQNPRIQTLIILSDTTQGYVAENPRNDDDNPLPRAIIASGPTIRVPGCNKVVDITGRTVNVTISDDQVMVKDLPRGTYFVTGNRQNIKVVKM